MSPTGRLEIAPAGIDDAIELVVFVLETTGCEFIAEVVLGSSARGVDDEIDVVDDIDMFRGESAVVDEYNSKTAESISAAIN